VADLCGAALPLLEQRPQDLDGSAWRGFGQQTANTTGPGSRFSDRVGAP
jgi:hypothetical protein